MITNDKQWFDSIVVQAFQQVANLAGFPISRLPTRNRMAGFPSSGRIIYHAYEKENIRSVCFPLTGLPTTIKGFVILRAFHHADHQREGNVC